MARMCHDSERAAMIYQHEARGADKAITAAIDRHVQTERDDEDDGTTGDLAPAGSWPANGPAAFAARKAGEAQDGSDASDLALRGGAGDENRTRTISLGSRCCWSFLTCRHRDLRGAGRDRASYRG